MTTPFITELLTKHHHRAAFSCHEPSLDSYIKEQAGQDQKRHVAAVFVLPDEDQYIKGFYTLSAAGIPSDDLPESILNKLPKHPTQPATLLGRLAIDQAHQGQGLGELLLVDALFRSYTLAQQIGSIAVIVDPLNEQAKKFYEKYGFIELPEKQRQFLPMKTIKQLFA